METSQGARDSVVGQFKVRRGERHSFDRPDNPLAVHQGGVISNGFNRVSVVAVSPYLLEYILDAVTVRVGVRIGHRIHHQRDIVAVVIGLARRCLDAGLGSPLHCR